MEGLLGTEEQGAEHETAEEPAEGHRVRRALVLADSQGVLVSMVPTCFPTLGSSCPTTSLRCYC